jgi:Rrf2 family transcriptional regulator, cysteine metabolism repressor
MQLTEQSQYALRAMLDLSLQSETALVKVSCIAQRQQIPRKFLAMILHRLRLGGFVEARRGSGGGYRLVRPPEQIKVGEILRAFEGRRPATGSGCKILADLWNKVDASVSAILDETTFADLVEQWRVAQRTERVTEPRAPEERHRAVAALVTT